MYKVAFLAVFLFAGSAIAAAVAPAAPTVNVPTGVSAEALNGNPVSDSMLVEGFTRIKLQIRLVRGGGATNVAISCEESDDNVTWSEIQVDTAGTLTKWTATRTTSVTVNVTVERDIYAYVYMRCTLTGASSTVDDTVTLIARKSRGN